LEADPLVGIDDYRAYRRVMAHWKDRE